MKKILLFFLCLFIFSHANAENDKAFFWQVKPSQTASKQAIVYLMGSIHFADKSFYPLRKKIETAFAKSDSLVVELDINNIDPQTYNQLLAQKGVYKDGRTIKDVVSEETWLQLRQSLQQLNIPYDSVKSYKPGVLVLTLAAVQVMQMGFNAELGIDVYFLSKAKAKQKKIIALETLTQQINIFLDIPNAELLLKESLYSLDEAELQMAEIVEYWKTGNNKKMNKLLFEDALNDYPAFDKIYDSLFYDRNNKMVLKIEQMLKQPKGRYFVVVGSGHLIGEKGIVNALRKKGYTVQRR
ncbi:hypothetical protein MNBD_GAMMA06-1300 [hydrothermal vent metagenome]|uniref:TraB/GumN family protein n=1 Tax=hydrothermal vent metagenome TaxID=652676 RepID=A0A3B0WT00_9ZZZZ